MSSFTDFDFAQQGSAAGDPFAEIPFDENAVAEMEAIFDGAETGVSTEGAEPVPASSAAETEMLSDPLQEAVFSEAAEPSKEEAEAQKRAAHEAAEEKRREEWEARKRAKKEAEEQQIQKVAAMSESELMNAAMERAGEFTEKILRRNLKECVTEHIQMLCCGDPAFAKMTMHPRKNMIRCFQYINRKAFEYVQDEMKVDGFTPSRDNPVYTTDIPDGMCYQWAEDYFRDPTVQEDQEKEEEFIPKPYPGTTVKKTAVKKTEKKKAEKKAAPKKEPPVKKNPKEDENQFSFDCIMGAAAVGTA